MAKVKPKKHKKEYWDYNEVAHYLEVLHGKNFRDYAGKFNNKTVLQEDIPYQDFWHFITDCNEVNNGCFIHLPDWDYYMNNKTTEPWVKEIMRYFHDFLGEDYHEEMWVWW